MFKYYLYRDMTLNGMQASHIVHFYKHKFRINPVKYQDWPDQAAR